MSTTIKYKMVEITAIVIVSFFAILLVLDKTVFKHTPESVLKVAFGINLKDFDYNVETFEEEWYPNGDGYVFVVYRFNKFTSENIDYFKNFELMPLSTLSEYCKISNFDKIPAKFFEEGSSYYIYKPLHDVDIRDYQIFIVNTEQKAAVLYYQYM